MRERAHHYRYCPQCKASVEPGNRFCRSCYFWLARPSSEQLRDLALPTENRDNSLLSRFWLFENLFQTSFIRLSSIVFLVLVGLALAVYYITALAPTWYLFSPRLRKNACYANMRVIQTAIEEYCLERRFTPELGRNPAKTLFDAGHLRNLPTCPIPGNSYTIPRGAVLQCVGSEPHGIP